MIGSDICQSDADYSQSHPDSSQSDADHGCKASDHLPVDQENGRRGQEHLLVRADCGLRNREHGLRDSDCYHDDIDHGHGRTENGIGRADHGLIRQSNFRPRSLSENSKGSRAWGLHGERKARGGGDVDAHRLRRATQRSSCNPHAPFGFWLERGICFVGAPRRCAPTSPASRRLASAPSKPGTRPLPILGQAPRTFDAEKSFAKPMELRNL